MPGFTYTLDGKKYNKKDEKYLFQQTKHRTTWSQLFFQQLHGIEH